MNNHDDAYARRQRRKQREGQGCALLLVAGAGGLLGLAVLAAEGLGRLL